MCSTAGAVRVILWFDAPAAPFSFIHYFQETNCTSSIHRTTYRFLLSPRLFFFPSSSSRCSENLRFTPRAKSRRSLHSIFVVSPLKEKSASHWRVRVRDVFWSVRTHQRSFPLFVTAALQSSTSTKNIPSKKVLLRIQDKSFKWVSKHPQRYFPLKRVCCL